jgi:hypothetical protein
MNHQRIVRAIAFLGLWTLTGILTTTAQVDPKTQMYRDDAKGDYDSQAKGILNGNRVRTIYFNTTEVAHWPDGMGGEWPKGTGHNYIDGLTVLVGAKLRTPTGRVVTPIEAHYREEFDYDPLLGQQYAWDLEPVPGYNNTDLPAGVKPSPAVNIDSTSWPDHWPVALRADGRTTAEWDGYWYGYFGRGVQNADFETFFVVDDSKDAEYQRIPYNYNPIAADLERGGLGLRIEVRGFQWSHVLAEDVIFWHYDIVNISDYDYDSCAFGFYSDPGVGSYKDQGPANSAYYNTTLDLCYSWAEGGKGLPDNWKTGYYGYAYLESPGDPWDAIDNDGDGMINERRDNGIDDDHDWTPFSDTNGNGKWDVGEALNDDLGADGVGPYDLQYNGPDAGEGDGIPTHGEPNFDETDKDESDQIGLTAVALNVLGDKGPTGVWPKNDDVMWKRMNNGFVDTLVQNTNIGIVFASGPFHLAKNRRERFSMALVYGLDLDALLFNKITVQNIYNANYNFSKPPYTPRLKAVAGDRKVYLSWDDRAERSRDPFLGNKLDFEGYLVYRSTDAEFNDIKIITDSKGSPRYWKPIAQFDLRDSISGPDPIGINGARFWRGSNTGLQHSYIDTNVVNGQRYYYALVSYDMGDPTKGQLGLQPTECPKIITEDAAGKLKFIDINCAIMTPSAPSAGYMPPQIQGNLKNVTSGLGTGHLNMQVLDPNAITEGTKYRVVFDAAGSIPKYTTSAYSVLRFNVSGSVDTLMKNVPATDFGNSILSAPFDGMSFSFINDTAIVVIDTACRWTHWTNGTPGVIPQVLKDDFSVVRDVAWPADYRLDWFSAPADTTAFNLPPRYPKMPVNFQLTNTSSNQRVKFFVDDADRNGSLSFGDTIRIIENYVNPTTYNLTYKINWERGPGLEPALPQAGDQFVIKTRRPFNKGDFFEFLTKKEAVNTDAAKRALGQISVVPNPYIATSSMERRSLFTSGRGDHEITFIHLPARCTVRIFTVAGHLVKALAKDSGPADGSLSWDLVTDDGMDLAYGLYIYHVEADGVGEHIGKFAVIK